MATTIGACCQVFAGSSAPQDKAVFVSEGIPFVRAGSLEHLCSSGSLDDCEQINKEVGKKLKLRLAPAGTVLFAKSGMSAMKDRVYCLPREAYVVSHLAGLIPSESVDSRYLAYWFLVNPPSRLINDPGYPSIRLSDISKVKFDPPSLNEQKRIAAILDKADEIRDSIQQVQNIRSELVDNIFFDMFGDPVINPNNYKFVKMIELMSDGFQNGLYIPKDKYVDSDGVEMVHMSDAFYDTVQRGCLKQALLEESEITKYNLSSNNLLITRRSLNYEGAAKSCRIPQSNTPLVFESSLIRLAPNEKVVNATFLHFYINNKRVREAYVYKFVTKSTISGINQKNLSQIPVMLPPIELQNKFMQNVHFLQQIPDSMELSTNNLASISQEMLT